MRRNYAAAVLRSTRRIMDGLGVASNVQVRHASGPMAGPAGHRQKAPAVTVRAYVEEIGAEEWSWAATAWSETVPARMTRSTFLEPVRIGQGTQVGVEGEPWRQVRDWRVDGQAVTTAVIA